MSEARHISGNFVVMDGSFNADILLVTENLYAELDQTYGDFAGRSLISCHRFDGDWPTWEIHPAGDEFVLLLSGGADLIFATNDGEVCPAR